MIYFDFYFPEDGMKPGYFVKCISFVRNGDIPSHNT